MIFNSFQFIWLFPLIFLIYWGCARLDRNGLPLSKAALLIISYGVYLQWNFAFGLVLLYVTAITYVFAICISRRPGRAKALVWIGSLLALIPLLGFKYLNFITQAGASALQWVGIDVAPPALTWVVPLGLSFYTFQAVGYLCQVYRRQIEPERNWWTYMLFVSFFPQILCGPISSAADLLPQLRVQKREFSYPQAVSGMRMILWGLFLKTVLADRLGLYVDTIYAQPASFSGSSSLLAAIFYSLQIYGDFGGYSYIAVGVARLLGINLIVNFRRPYLAQSVSQFWKRWNISLTRWLTANIFIPLGGSRCGRLRNYANIMITFLVSGIWHGANWTFIFWGGLHGLAQSIEKFFGLNRLESRGFLKIVRICVSFAVVTLAWIYFRSPSIGFANQYIFHLITDLTASVYVDAATFGYGAIALLIVVPIEMFMEFRPSVVGKMLNGPCVVRWSVYLLLALLILGIGVLDSGQFIYIQF